MSTPEKHSAPQAEHVSEIEPTKTVRVDEDVFANMEKMVSNFDQVNDEAYQGTRHELEMTAWQAIRAYPKAAAYSFTLSLALVMEGYDTSLLGSFFGYPTFQERFGRQLSDGSYQLTASWQSGLQAAVQIGEILGLWFAGLMAHKYGYRRTMIGALILMAACIFVMFFAQNIAMLFCGYLLCGLPWGAFQTITTTYAAEIGPAPLRPILTTYVNMCWVIGQTISAGVLKGFLNRDDQWAWRIPYGLQWIWPPIIIVGVLLAPESPWWLVQQDRTDEARKILLMLKSGNDPGYDVDNHIAMFIHTNAQEKALDSGTSYKNCFKGIDLRRTEIACCVWMIQVGCGVWFGSNVVYFLQQAGFDPDNAFSFNLGKQGVALLGTICAWFIMQYVGRRTLYLWGLAANFTILVIVGFLGIPQPSDSIAYSTGAFLYCFTFIYDITVGPVCYCLVAEIPSTRLRVKTVALARNCYNVVSIGANFLNNPILNPSSWNLRGKGGFVWCGFALISFVWAYFRLPETRGLTSGQLDLLFSKGIPARKFHDVKADPFRSVNDGEKKVDVVEKELKE